MGKFGLMAGTAAIAMFAASGANAAVQNDQGATTVVNQPSMPVQLAQNELPPSNAHLGARRAAVEAKLSTPRCAPPRPPVRRRRRRPPAGGATPPFRAACISTSP